MGSRASTGTADQSSTKLKRLTKLWLLFVAVFLLSSIWTIWQQREQLSRSETDLSRLDKSFQEAQQLHDQYELEITRLNTPEYIEQRVRKDFQMSRPGDVTLTPPKPGS
ncbi:FtsB family cell division protein [Paenibacillus turpanensis]|uniref:FtsB family cell division protein n=1 Tax=Paenibacillus turpanensis TaxID=2689078 RepID=UPI00140E2F6D|nr:septum formation initiator family protein [Paenibacillus turpanensis]